MGAKPEEPSGLEPGLRVRFGFDLEEQDWFRRLAQSEVTWDPLLGQIGEYELLAAVGRGGQGVVYRARQPRTGRVVALKRISAGIFATPAMQARFAREMEAAAALDHPGVVSVFGSEIIDGQQILAMQWIDGLPFDRWAHGEHSESESHSRSPRRRGLRELLKTFVATCEAVQHAHQRGVLHRDLKPSNILVDRAGQPHVLDFGLAKLIRENVADPSLTQTGVFVGTPVYAAPELARAEHRKVDVRSDVYALGVVLYQALTGQTPFDGELELTRLLREIQQREPRAPSAIDASLGRELDAIVLKALAKEPELRYPSVEALAADVLRFLAGEAVLAHPPSTTYRVRKFIRKNSIAITVGVAFLALALGAAAVSTRMYLVAEGRREDASDALKESSKQLKIAEDQRLLAERRLLRAQGATYFLDRLLEKAHRGASGGVPAITLREALDLVAEDVNTALEPWVPEVEAWVRMAIANAYAALEERDLALAQYKRTLKIRREIYPGDDLDVAEAMEKLGRLSRTMGDFDTAEVLLEEALGIRQRVIGNWADPYFAVNLNSLGILKRHQQKLADAEHMLSDALHIYWQAFGPNNESIPIVLGNLGLVYLDLGRIEEADTMLLEAERLALALHGEEHIDVAGIQVSLGTTRWRLGKLDQAEGLFRTVIATLSALQGDCGSNLAIAKERLAQVLEARSSLQEAERLRAQSLQCFQHMGRALDLLGFQSRAARCLREAGDSGQAELVLREALCTAQEKFVPADFRISACEVELAACLLDMGDYEEASALLHSVRDILLGYAEPPQVLANDLEANLSRL